MNFKQINQKQTIQLLFYYSTTTTTTVHQPSIQRDGTVNLNYTNSFLGFRFHFRFNFALLL